MLNIYKLLCAWIVSQLFFYSDWPVRPDRILFVLLLLTFFWLRSRGGVNRLSFGKTEFCMLAFTLVANVSLFLAGSNVTSGLGKNTQLLQVANLSFYPFITYFLMKHIPYSREGVRSVLKTLVVMGCYLTATAICERYGMYDFIWPKYISDPGVGIHFGRARGPLLNSVFLGLNLIFCVAAMLIQWETMKGPKRHLLVIAVLASMVSIYFTNTRGPWIGLAVLLITTLFFPLKMRRAIGTLILLVTLAFGLGNASKFSLSNGTLFSKRQNTVVDRQVNYKVAWMMGVENPVFGIGWGQMGREFEKYFEQIGAKEFGGWDGNHNEWLGVFAQLGLLGLVPYVFIFIHFGRLTLQTYRRLPRELLFERSLMICALGLLCCFVIMSNFSDVHSSPLHNNLLFMFYGFVASVARALKRPVRAVVPSVAARESATATAADLAFASRQAGAGAARMG